MRSEVIAGHTFNGMRLVKNNSIIIGQQLHTGLTQAEIGKKQCVIND